MDANTILALGTLVTSIATAFATVFTLLKGNQNGAELKKIHAQTDGMKDELVAAVKVAARAEGVVEGKAVEKERAADVSERVATRNAIADKPEGS